MLAFSSKAADIKYFEDKTVRLVIGIVTLVVGFVKLFVVSKVPVFGDLIPVIAGLSGGFTLILEYYLQSSNIEVKEGSFIHKIFVINKRAVGILCLAAALLHFLFPKILFL